MATVDAREWFSLLAAIGQLTLAIVALARGNKSSMARPLAALCFVVFGWNFSTLAQHVVGGSAFSVLDAIFTALSPAFVLEVVLRFVGRTRRAGHARVFAWTWLGALAVASAAGFVAPRALAWLDQPSWSAAFLAGWLPTLSFETWLLVVHLRSTTDPTEKARTRTVFAALAIGTSFALTDVVHAMGMPVPYLGALGSLLSGILLVTLVVRFELLDRNVSARSAAYVLVMAAAFVVVYLLVFRLFATNFAAQVFAMAVVTLVVATVARELFSELAEERERGRSLAVVGRFSAQMAHDVRGPLTALLGAVQVLEGLEKDDEATRKEFLDLVADQARRVAAIVERYDRMGRVEPNKTLVDLNEVVRGVARTHGIGTAFLELAEPAECEADRDLVASAVENVVRNAVEATDGKGGDVRVVTVSDPAAFVVRVIDRGSGMDARHVERAFEDFFTTKPRGTGLGLAFVRRVMLAHGGDATIASAPGAGTTVELRLPRV